MMHASLVLSLLILSTSGRWSFTLNLFAQARPVSTAASRNLVGRNSPPSRPDSAQEGVLTSAIIISLLLFVIISGCLITYVLFGSKIRGYLRPQPKLPKISDVERGSQQPPISSPVPSYGFGFDGLTETEIEAFYAKEDQGNSPKLSIKVPASPPYLTLKHQSDSESPISPMDMEWDRSSQVIFQSPDIVDQSALTSRRTSGIGYKEESATTTKLPLIAIAPKTRESSPLPVSSHFPQSESRSQVHLPDPDLSVKKHSELIELPFYPSDRTDEIDYTH